MQPISFFFLCEGSKDSKHIIEFDKYDQHKLFPVDISSQLHDVCNKDTLCDTEVLWDASFLESFTSMCISDVLITSTSGFSWTSAVFCEPKLTLGIKFSQDYDGIANVVNVEPHDHLWQWQTKVRLDGLEEKWQNMIENLIKH